MEIAFYNEFSGTDLLGVTKKLYLHLRIVFDPDTLPE